MSSPHEQGPVYAWSQRRKVTVHMADGDVYEGTLTYSDSTGVAIELVDKRRVFIPYTAISSIEEKGVAD